MITLEPNRSFEHLLPGRDRAFFYGLADEVTVAGHAVQPIGQPVAMGGPFVMNTKTEITQAFNDFHSGKFGDIPWQARLKYR